MSQKKVDEYKKYKANRKEILEKEKQAKKRNKALSVVAGIVFLVVFAVAAIQTFQSESLRKVAFSNLIAQDEYGFIIPIMTEN